MSDSPNVTKSPGKKSMLASAAQNHMNNSPPAKKENISPPKTEASPPPKSSPAKSSHAKIPSTLGVGSGLGSKPALITNLFPVENYPVMHHGHSPVRYNPIPPMPEPVHYRHSPPRVMMERASPMRHSMISINRSPVRSRSPFREVHTSYINTAVKV
jgi:hypothetical protein